MASSPRIEELRKKFEENPRRYFAPLANEYRKAGDIEQAIAICREYLPQQPGHMSGHIVYGQALYEARQVDEAKSVFETALSLDPENLIALRHLGDIALMVGDAAGARAWYGRVLEADPRNEEIQAQLARLDQTESAAPTPVVTPTIEPRPEPAAATEGAAPSSPMPTPSSAPTVVVSAIRPPTPRPPVEEPVDRPLETVPAESAPADLAITLQPTPAVPPPAIEPPVIEKSAHAPIGLEPTSMAPQETFGTQPTVPLDVSIVEKIAQQREAAPMASFSVEGLETTSIASQSPEAPTHAPEGHASPPEQEQPPAPPAPVQASEPEAVPELVVEELPAESAAATPAPADDLPLLDIGDIPVGAAARAAAATTPEVPSAPQPGLEPGADANAPPVAELELDTRAPDSGPFVTETMAELYLHQGHAEDALRVYRALLEQRPDDLRLQEKIAALTALSAPAAPAEHPPAHASTPAPTRDATAPRVGRSIREMLVAIAMRRPGSAAGEPVHAANGGTPASEPAAVPVAQDQRPRLDDRLSVLFGAVESAPPDESAALVLAQAFMELNGLEEGRAAVVSGAPAHPANSELSLDAVFKADDDKPAPASFSFDQFFSQRATAEHPTPASSAVTDARPRDDATQFTKWLEGLKQR